jgi:hypothetical protein
MRSSMSARQRCASNSATRTSRRVGDSGRTTSLMRCIQRARSSAPCYHGDRRFEEGRGRGIA